MKNIFLAIGVIVSLLLVSCEEIGWKQSDIAYTSVYTVTGLTGIDSLDIYPDKGFVIEYTNSGTTLAKYTLNELTDTISDDGAMAYMKLSYTMPESYEYTDADGNATMIDATIDVTIDGSMSYTDDNIDNKFELGDVVGGYLVEVLYNYTSPETADEVNYNSYWLFGENIVSVTSQEKYN